MRNSRRQAFARGFKNNFLIMNDVNMNEMVSRKIGGENPRDEKKLRDAIFGFSLLALLFVLIFVLEKILPRTSMLFTVLKKGAIYALVAVSMNLLNGFTGLFSLGQAGFMMIGAYTYAVFTIPVAQRAAVYQYFDGGIIQFTIPVFAAIILAGLVAAFFAFLIGLPVLHLKSDYLAIATLGFSEIMRAIFQWDKLGIVTNGSNLLRKYPVFPLDAFSVRGERGVHRHNRAFDKFHLRTRVQGDPRRRSGGRSDGNKFGAPQKNELRDFIVFRGNFRRAFGDVPNDDSGESIQKHDDLRNPSHRRHRRNRKRYGKLHFFDAFHRAFRMVAQVFGQRFARHSVFAAGLPQSRFLRGNHGDRAFLSARNHGRKGIFRRRDFEIFQVNSEKILKRKSRKSSK